MDKTAIKNFAVRARNKLIEQVKQKAFEIGIEKGKIVEPKIKENNKYVLSDYKSLNNKEYEQRKRLIVEIELKNYEQVMEEVAYTWFNRFVALRFMEVNSYLLTGIRVLSSETQGKVEPDIVTEALNLVDLDIDKETIYQYQDDNDTNGLYKYLLIKQCNSLNDIMPFIFEKIADYTEILLPDNLLSEGSVIRDMVESISEDDWKEQVEIIGWLYQFYISEKKDEVFASKGKVKKEEIPAATQLFTPDWIVKYMVENSLGKYWLESNPNGDLQGKWKYYLEEPEQEPEVQEQLEEIRKRKINPTEITILDPACGSGHILVYAFDVLYYIYKSAGYLESDIPQLILNNNLYGLEICDRAAQLASLSVMMKAREKDSRIFDKEVNLNICSIQESNRISDQAVDLLIKNIGDNEKRDIISKDLNYLIDVFEDAKNYGSILDVKKVDLDLIKDIINKPEYIKVDSLSELHDREVIIELLPILLNQNSIMSGKYDIVITNPPYMGSRNMNAKLKIYLKNSFKNSNRDLFAVFIEKCLDYSKKYGYIAMITMHSWMFLSSFEGLRENLINNITFDSMVHLGARAFEEIGGEIVQTTSFTLRNITIKQYNANYRRLVDYNSSEEKKIQYFRDENKYTAKIIEFEIISGLPIAYWISNKMRKAFEMGKPFDKIAKPKVGLQTGNNDKFLRLWFETDINNIGFGFNSRSEAKEKDFKWFPYNKGGNFRKWYGNNEYIVDWENDGFEIRNFKDSNGKLRSRPQNMKYYFKESMTWSDISGRTFGARYCPNGFIFDVKGSSGFPKKEDIHYSLAFLNSCLVPEYIDILNPTLTTQVGDLKRLPLLFSDDNIKEKLNNLVQFNIQISKTDWDFFETSWDFKRHPLLAYKKDAHTIEEAFNNWSMFTENQFYQLKTNEEELNRIVIDIYGLEDELTPEVTEEDITVRKADRERDIKSFISYAVGCMLGRYSLNEEGLAYAGGEFDESRYETFKVDKDGIIPILDDEYFDDDIVARFIDFLKVTFGEETLEENLDYIAETLGRRAREISRQAIRRYFANDFYKDHVQTFNKRPIYWLFQSDGRRKAFNALMYMHRYDSGTVARVRTDYLHELQKKIEAEKLRLQGVIDSDLSTREKNNAKKKLEKLSKDAEELIKYDADINHIANQQIEIDLDDGVEENYSKFADVLSRI